MEDQRGGAGPGGSANPVPGIFGSYYAKAKQRVLNKMGKRTTLTRNPRVDYISHKVDDIRNKKENVTNLAQRYASQLNQLTSTGKDLNAAFISAWRDELGERQWDAERKVYVRKLHPEEERLARELEQAMDKCNKAVAAVNDSFFRHLNEVAQKPLTFCTPEEASRVQAIAETKEFYKMMRTDYSDAMIDMDAEIEGGGEARPRTLERVEAARIEYEKASECMTTEALKFESLYRDELSQRVTAHFTAQLHLVRGANAAYRDFYPFSKSLTLDWQEMRTKRKHDLEMAKAAAAAEDDGMRSHATAALPDGSGSGVASAKRPSASSTGEQNPFGPGRSPPHSSRESSANLHSAVQVPSSSIDVRETSQETTSTAKVENDEDFFGLSRNQSASRSVANRAQGASANLDTVNL